MREIKKRVFFGLEIQSPWPEEWPQGRLIELQDRHATLAFLGEIPYQLLEEHLKSFPAPSFKVGLVGKYSKCLFLPPGHPKVIAWQIDWMENGQLLFDYQQKLTIWLENQGYHFKKHEGPWLPHVTLARSPFNMSDWKKNFHSLPLITSAIHLYESLGHSKYQKNWSYPLIQPFEEIEHTADIAYKIHGENLNQIHLHAQMALAFRYPMLLEYVIFNKVESLEHMVIDLNELVTRVDIAIGCPFKAISYHGEVVEKNSILEWEMIVDV